LGLKVLDDSRRPPPVNVNPPATSSSSSESGSSAISGSSGTGSSGESADGVVDVETINPDWSENGSPSRR